MSAADAARSYAALADRPAARATSGLINETFIVEGASGRYVLQRLHPIFDPRIHENILAVTEHLRARGMTTPELIRTDAGELHVDLGEGGIWRAMTFVEGATFDAAQDAAQLEGAGELVGRFHRALEDLDHHFVGLRVGVHDTDAHLAKLEAALGESADHRLRDQVVPLGEAILEAGRRLPSVADLPTPVAHGDLKLSNLRFAGPSPPASREGRCLIDLDTLAPMPLAHELGDAWRSWCNPNREDAREASFDLDGFAASWRGYQRGRGEPLAPAELESLVDGVAIITLELCARFAADAILEAYFGWDAQRFPGRGEHNLARARGQWALYQAVRDTRDQRRRILGC